MEKIKRHKQYDVSITIDWEPGEWHFLPYQLVAIERFGGDKVRHYIAEKLRKLKISQMKFLDKALYGHEKPNKYYNKIIHPIKESL